MPIDASIPLQVHGPNILSPVDLMNAQAGMQRNQLLALQLGQQQQSMQRNNMLRDMVSAPGAFDASGVPTNALLQGVAQSGNFEAHKALLDQQVGAEQKKALQAQQQARAQEQQATADKMYGEAIKKGVERSLSVHDQVLQKTGNEDLATQAGQLDWADVLDGWKKTNEVGPMLPRAPTQFDATKFTGMVDSYSQRVALQKQQQQFAQQSGLQAQRDQAASDRQAAQIAASDARQSRALQAQLSAGNSLDDATKDFAADLYRRTGQMPQLGYGKAATALRSEILTRAAQAAGNDGQTAGDVVAQRAGTKADTASVGKLQPQYDAVRSFTQNAAANGDRLIALAEKTDSTGIPVLERWIRAGRQATGDPDVAALNAQMTLFRNEAAKIVTNPNLTGVLTVEAQREMERSLNNAASPAQIRAVVNLLKQDFGTREKSLSDQIGVVKSRISAPGTSSTPKTINFADLP